MKSQNLSLVLALMIISFVVGCAKNITPQNNEASFEQKLDSAKKQLATTPTGSQTLTDIDRYTASGNLVGIKGISSKSQSGHQGGIHQVSSATYEILLPSYVSAQDLAHGLAHELVHVKNEIVEDQFLAANPELNTRLGGAASLKGQALQENYQAHKSDVDLFYASLVFEEIKAYQTNIQLENEGIPFSNTDLKSQGLFAYVKFHYLPDAIDLQATDDGTAFIRFVNTYENLVDFQKNWLLTTH